MTYDGGNPVLIIKKAAYPIFIICIIITIIGISVSLSMVYKHHSYWKNCYPIESKPGIFICPSAEKSCS